MYNFGFPVDAGDEKSSFVVFVRLLHGANQHSCKNGGMSDELRRDSGANLVFQRAGEYIKNNYRFEFELIPPGNPDQKEAFTPETLCDTGSSDSLACAMAIEHYDMDRTHHPFTILFSCTFKYKKEVYGVNNLKLEKVTSSILENAQSSLQNKWYSACKYNAKALVLHEDDAKILSEAIHIKIICIDELEREQLKKEQDLPILISCKSEDFQQVKEFFSTSIKKGKYIQGNNPYVGLAFYKEDQGNMFFGRDKEIKEVFKLLHYNNLIVIIGNSGSGKSSFVHAGILNFLKNEESWNSVVCSPGNAPFLNLEIALHNSNWNSSSEEIVTSNSLFKRIATGMNEDDKRIVFIDQFEEIFTLTHEKKRKAFITLLHETARIKSSVKIKFIIAMRSDFIQSLLVYKPFMDITKPYYLYDLDYQAVLDSVVKPADLFDYTISKSLQDQILEDMGFDESQNANEFGKLPLLQLSLFELWKFRDTSRRQLTLDAYKKIGGLANVISQKANDILDYCYTLHYISELQDKEILLSGIFLRLIQMGENAPIVRCSINKSVFSKLQQQIIYEVLIPQRLLITSEDKIELIHEILIRKWEKLQQWIGEKQEHLKIRDELEREAEKWTLASKDEKKDFLLRGRRLHTISKAVQKFDKNLIIQKKAQDFLSTSNNMKAKNNTILYFIIIIITFLTIVAIWYWQKKSRWNLSMKYLNKAVTLKKNKEFFLAKLYAGKAIGFDTMTTSNSKKYPILLDRNSKEYNKAKELINSTNSIQPVWFYKVTEQINSTAFFQSPSILIATQKGTVELFNYRTKNKKVIIREKVSIKKIIYSPDGKLFAYRTKTKIVICSSKNPKRRSHKKIKCTDFVFSPDSKKIAIVNPQEVQISNTNFTLIQKWKNPHSSTPKVIFLDNNHILRGQSGVIEVLSLKTKKISTYSYAKFGIMNSVNMFQNPGISSLSLLYRKNGIPNYIILLIGCTDGILHMVYFEKSTLKPQTDMRKIFISKPFEKITYSFGLNDYKVISVGKYLNIFSENKVPIEIFKNKEPINAIHSYDENKVIVSSKSHIICFQYPGGYKTNIRVDTEIYGISNSRTGRYIAIAGDPKVKIFDSLVNKTIDLPMPISIYKSIAFSRFDDLAVLDIDGKIYFWKKDNLMKFFSHSKLKNSYSLIVTNICSSPGKLLFHDSGKLLAISCSEYVKFFHVVKSLKLKWQWKHPEEVFSMAIMHKKNKLLTVCEDLKLRIFDINTGKIDKVLSEKEPTRSIACSSNGMIATSGDSGKVYIRNKAGKILRILNSNIKEPPGDLKFFSNGKYLLQSFCHISNIKSRSIYMWNLKQNRIIREFRGATHFQFGTTFLLSMRKERDFINAYSDSIYFFQLEDFFNIKDFEKFIK